MQPNNQFSNNLKLSIYAGLAAFAFMAIGLTSYYTLKPKSIEIAEITPATCAKDLYTCPDNTKVGRTGSACEFVCPNRASLYFSPTSSQLTTTSTQTTTLTVNPNSLAVTGASINLTYDPNLIIIDKIEPSTAFPTILVAPSFTTSPATFTLGVPTGTAQNSTAPVALATITYHSKNAPTTTAKNTSFTLTDKTILTATSLSSTSALSGGNLTHPILVQVEFMAGDLNTDRKVDLFDFNLLVSNYNNPYTILDFNDIVRNFGKTI